MLLNATVMLSKITIFIELLHSWKAVGNSASDMAWPKIKLTLPALII